MTGPDSAAPSHRLMRDIAAAREPALEKLSAMHGRDVTLFVTRFLRNAAEGEDVVQETFLRVWQTAARYDPDRAAVSTWIYRIATNLCIDRQRRGRFWRRFSRADAGDVAGLVADDAADAASTLAACQQLDRVRRAITALPDRQRSAILLSVVAGLEGREIATILDTNPGAVEQVLVRGHCGRRRGGRRGGGRRGGGRRGGGRRRDMAMHDHDDDDGRTDALVRSASLRPVNEARLAASVLSRVRQDQRPAMGNWAALFALPRFAGPGRFAPAGFALLLATPTAVARCPGDDTKALIAALAPGDTLLLDGGVLQ